MCGLVTGSAVIAGGNHGRIVVGALSHQDVVVVEALGRGVEVPFADDRGLVAGLLQQLGKRLLVAVEGVAVAEEPVEVAVLAGLDHGAARAADGIGDVAAVEAHALVGDAVHVRGGHARRIVGTERLLTVVIGKDEDDVGPLIRRR